MPINHIQIQTTQKEMLYLKEFQGQSGFYIPLIISVSSTKVNKNGFVQNIYTTEMNTYNADKCTCALICRREEVQFSICTELCVHCLVGP